VADATAAVTNLRITPHEQSHITERPLKATAATYYPGQMLMQAAADGFLINAADTAAMFFSGFLVASQKVVVPSGGADGDVKVKVARPRYAVVKHSGLVRADEGKAVYIVDNQTVALAGTTTNDIKVGTIHKWLSASEVQVEIPPFGT
jgi:hypothetical protein